MKPWLSFFMACAIFTWAGGAVLAQCDTCEPDLECVAVDFPLLCPEQLPDAIQGEPYAATTTFNLPASVVDPASGIEAQLLTVTISQVTGLPFGLDFTPNNPDGVYEPGNGEQYGCAVVCGTPLVSGSFFVNIEVAVLVSAFGFQQTVNESFTLPLWVEPGESGDGPSSFSLSATQGCVPLEIQGTNLVEEAGASCLWDFGNGQTSDQFNPSFAYDSAGTYTVTVQTEVSELALTQVNITALGGGWGQDIEDLFGSPDPYFVLSGPEGELYTSAYADGNETPTLGGFSIPLSPGTTYNIAFYDSDGVFTGDDFLGSSDFVPVEGGDLTVSNSTTAILTLTETVVASFNESTQVVVFEGLVVYQDLDGDGYGDPNVLVDACDPDNALPYAFNDQDCDDANATMYTGAEPTGQGIDNNCDGVVDGLEVLTILGCTDPAATNYDSMATVDDGTCEYPPCLGDLNGDLMVSVADILEMLGDFGCNDNCSSDLTGDDAVSVDDLLTLLANFGLDCPE